MPRSPSKIAVLFAFFVGVWAVVYWVWPSQEPHINKYMGEAPPLAEVIGRDADAQPAPRIVVEPRPVAPAPLTPIDLAARPPEQRTITVERQVEPTFRTYKVRKGDVSFDAIARRPEVYGDASKGKVIARANPLVTPDKLRPGKTELRIPVDPTNIQGKIVTEKITVPANAVTPDGKPIASLPESKPGPAASPTAKQPPTAPGSSQTYTVQPDDTLSGIAKRFLGKTSAWQLILDANRDKLDSPEHLRAGMTLVIPPKPAN